MKGYRISIVRHGITEANENGIYIGKTDLPLSDAGREVLEDKYDQLEYPKVQRVSVGKSDTVCGNSFPRT